MKICEICKLSFPPTYIEKIAFVNIDQEKTIIQVCRWCLSEMIIKNEKEKWLKFGERPTL